MLTVVTTRPPSIYIFIPSLQFNSILGKTTLFVLHVESHKFLSLVSSWVIVVVAIVGATVAEARGCWCCCYPRELALVLEGACVLHSCQPTKWRSFNRFQMLSLPFSFCLSLFCSWSYRVKTKNKKQKRYNAALARAATHCRPSSRVAALSAECRELQRCRPSAASCSAVGRVSRVVMLLAIAVVASCNLLPTSPQQRATTLCRPRHNSELQRSAGFATAASCNLLPASPQQWAATLCRPRHSNEL